MSSLPLVKRALVFTLCAASCAFALAQSNPVGRFQVQGRNPDGSSYGDTAQISWISNTTCRITWNTGGTVRGICMRSGSAFAASYVMGGEAGLAIYEIKPDGSLDGSWTIAGQSGAGGERLVPTR